MPEVNSEAEQSALFELEGPDDDKCVWLHSGGVTLNLGPSDAVAERFYEWLACLETKE